MPLKTTPGLHVRTALRSGAWCYDPYWGWYYCSSSFNVSDTPTLP